MTLATTERCARKLQQLHAAQEKLRHAQERVNSLKRTIEEKKQLRAKLLKKKVCRDIRYWVPTPSWRKPFAGHYKYKTVCVSDTNALAQVARLQTEIGVLTTSLVASNTALTVARHHLNSVQRVVEKLGCPH